MKRTRHEIWPIASTVAKIEKGLSHRKKSSLLGAFDQRHRTQAVFLAGSFICNSCSTSWIPHRATECAFNTPRNRNEHRGAAFVGGGLR